VEKDLTRPDLRALVNKRRDRFTVLPKPTSRIFRFAIRLQFLQRHQGSRRGSHRRHWPQLCLASAIPFDEYDGARNYLSKVQRYAKAYDNVNSISHRGDYAGPAWTCGTARALWHL